MCEALGEMGLHPWELYEYSMLEFISKRKGLGNKELGEWHRARFVAYYAASGNLKKGTKITDILKLPGDKKTTKEAVTAEWYKQRKELLEAIGNDFSKLNNG